MATLSLDNTICQSLRVHGLELTSAAPTYGGTGYQGAWVRINQRSTYTYGATTVARDVGLAEQRILWMVHGPGKNPVSSAPTAEKQAMYLNPKLCSHLSCRIPSQMNDLRVNKL